MSSLYAGAASRLHSLDTLECRFAASGEARLGGLGTGPYVGDLASLNILPLDLPAQLPAFRAQKPRPDMPTPTAGPFMAYSGNHRATGLSR